MILRLIELLGLNNHDRLIIVRLRQLEVGDAALLRGRGVASGVYERAAGCLLVRLLVR